jgi:hypothetical protein
VVPQGAGNCWPHAHELKCMSRERTNNFAHKFDGTLLVDVQRNTLPLGITNHPLLPDDEGIGCVFDCRMLAKITTQHIVYPQE